MSFDHPHALWALVVLIPLVLISHARFGKRFKTMNPLVKKRLAVSSVFFILFLLSFIIVLAGPRRGSLQAPNIRSRDLDIVIALDLSRSMDIADYTDKGEIASRLQRGISIALEMIEALPGVRFAAAAGRSRGVLTVPLTYDCNAVTHFLHATDSTLLSGRGTNLESLLDAAAGAFRDTQSSQRYILLVSDGESLSGLLKSAVERCKRDNIAIIALALGSDTGQPLPSQSGLTAGGDVLISSRDQKAMQMAAELSGGFYIDGYRSDASGIISGYLRSRSAFGTAPAATESASDWFVYIIIAALCYCISKICMFDLKIRKAGYQK